LLLDRWSLAREVALTYRRTGRQRRAEGATIQQAEHEAAEAASTPQHRAKRSRQAARR
jgi:hypothetical protein